MNAATDSRSRPALLPAAGSGLIAGIVMAMVAMMATAVMGMGFLAPLAMIGGIVLGPDAAMSGGGGVLATGAVLHMILSMMFGAIFSLGLRYVAGAALWLGAAYGIVLWLVNFYVVGAVLPGAHAMAAHEPLPLAAGSHLVFGLVLGALVRRPH